MSETRFETSVTRTFPFEASHQLEWHDGKCANLHGHSYKLVVTVAGDLSDFGIIIDFAALKAIVHEHVIAHYDHRHLNSVVDNPTAERLASDAAARLLAAGLSVVEVTVRETDNCSATVRVLP